MAHVVTTQVLEAGAKFTVVKITIKGDVATATELVNAVLFDASLYSSTQTDNKLFDISYCLNGFSAKLIWDASTDVTLMSLEQDKAYHNCYVKFGGLKNATALAGRTGDILITTSGLASTAKDGHITLRLAWR